MIYLNSLDEVIDFVRNYGSDLEAVIVPVDYWFQTVRNPDPEVEHHWAGLLFVVPTTDMQSPSRTIAAVSIALSRVLRESTFLDVLGVPVIEQTLTEAE